MNKLSLYELSDHYLRALDAFADPEMDFPSEAIKAGEIVPGAGLSKGTRLVVK